MARKKSLEDYQLIDETDFQAAEAFKALRTNLEYSLLNEGGKVITVTSTIPQEGKTNVVVNLGVYLTYTGNKVLILDCDLRKPRIHRYFGMTNHVGFTNVIMKKYTLDSALKNINDQLSILCSGPIPPTPVELLSSKEAQAIIKELSTRYDYVLIDTPPSLSLTDAAVLSAVTNGVLFVIKHASTPADVIRTAMDNLKKVNANIIGTVITQINTKKLRGHDKYRYDRYYENYTGGVHTRTKRTPKPRKKYYSFKV